LKLHKIVKDLGMEEREIIDVLELANKALKVEGFKSLNAF
jgi:hypothetical protein